MKPGGGDGFEAIWNSRNTDLILVGSQGNGFAKSRDGGINFDLATVGIQDGPFLTRMANSPVLPDRVFALSENGVYVTNDFADRWSLNEITSNMWSFWSGADIEVSFANRDIVWAGGLMVESARLFVSEDGGKTFNPTEIYDNMGYLSGIGTHPVEANTAYAIFGYSQRPKVLKTEDLGQTWTDISGFDGTGDRGFPDVPANCILVFPNDPNHIWVGTEIGIVESKDAGETWALVDANFPPANVHQLILRDDQVVVATYGRGIWSVTIEGSERNVIFPPLVNAVGIAPSGETVFDISYETEFDSVHILLDDEIVLRRYDNALGASKETIDNLGIQGQKGVKIRAYLNGFGHTSTELTQLFFEPEPVAAGYGTNFFGAAEDFIGNGFGMKLIGGFDDIAMHSPHEYPENTELIYILKTPIEVASSNAFLNYRDIAIIERGQPGTVFGDSEFWDYVIVEATIDGVNWIPLLDGYDASYDDEWRDVYEDELTVNASLFRDHSIDLLEKFEAGDDILIRFRLYSDQLTVGWGWVVDDLYIQAEPLGTQSNDLSFEIYPNPMVSSADINHDLKGAVKLEIVNLQGQIVNSFQLKSGQNTFRLDKANLKSGVYVVRLSNAHRFTAKKLIIQ